MEVFRQHWAQIRILIAGLLALFVALGMVYAILTFRTWEMGEHRNTGTKIYTEQEKLQILAGLSSTTTVSEKQKSKTLQNTSSSKTSPSQEERLKILQSLQGK